VTEVQTIDLNLLADAIADRLSKKAPLEDTLWSAKDCADYFRVNDRHFKERMATHHQFPKASRFPISGGGKKEDGKTHPRWYALEVIEWGKRYRPR
jgi:hypothetical protein